MTKDELIALIDEKINSNGKGDITGASLNEVLKAISQNGGGGGMHIQATISDGFFNALMGIFGGGGDEYYDDYDSMEYYLTTIFQLVSSKEEIDAVYESALQGNTNITCGGVAEIAFPEEAGSVEGGIASLGTLGINATLASINVMRIMGMQLIGGSDAFDGMTEEEMTELFLSVKSMEFNLGGFVASLFGMGIITNFDYFNMEVTDDWHLYMMN